MFYLSWNLNFIFLANLYSKDDKARSEAADACKRLASKISDQKTLEDILKKCFDVFHGSEGKLTVIDYKMSVLQVFFFNLENKSLVLLMRPLVCFIPKNIWECLYFYRVLEISVLII